MEESKGSSFSNSPKKNAEVGLGAASGSWKIPERKRQKGKWIKTHFCLDILLVLCGSATALTSHSFSLPYTSQAASPRTKHSGGVGIEATHWGGRHSRVGNSGRLILKTRKLLKSFEQRKKTQ